ncbi:Rrf2 family transcriptional regulator [Guyparkeria sp. SCN-R1]|uniref:Fe-S cluster assembly transcription factor n=1 Tax=Guyparkeria sp. SCN-R1 TaxID=2341113 RepID=UPI000F64821F|nr:Fe-S cluster assembly transcription factor [Guyparkeria sp. SCN-R1]RRQ23522.1 Rrf2 family transcriptional regulator [Guyparkeria sp. SCN-R1]
MRLTTKGRYAVTAMLDLAIHDRGQPTALADIAERQSLSLSYLEQLFAQLRRGQLVSSVRGPGGGYQLAREPARINIAEIVHAVDEVVDVTRCGGRGNCQDGGKCLAHDLWMGLSAQIQGFLESISLADLVEQPDVLDVSARQDDRLQQTRDERSEAAAAGMRGVGP